ncbi:iron complex outermembrane recepter protein [Pseudoxanthomonas sp. CF385]|uniref:TonB-dependent receptor n=1 Tax=Pseudoxanthomonas sp. CF385 TaxID=1881042 RepID=UPI000888B6AB|nr:TonB-dependent receptor [Pseudoxanthomonas sp. CF385]SDQ34636.1 iron complex outermembrane recepter protein [Pseudoxanthomonas sp. CF385]
MKQVPAAFGVFLLAAAVSASVKAQQNTPLPPQDATTEEAKAKDAVDLDQVIVTGVRAPKAVDKIPGAVSLVSKEEIAHTLLVTEDATAVLARTVPGYAEASQAMSNSGETLRGRVALRLFDGVPQGSPLRDGSRNATFTDMGIVGRVEVINGPSASEGVGASGGIINYISTVPTKEGSEFRFLSRYSTQFKDDSAGWKLGLNYAYKQDNYDLVAGVSRIDRGMGYDADGVRLGMNTSGSLHDSVTRNLFVKGGINFGEDLEKRLQVSYSDFKIEGNGNYIQVDGCRYEPGWCEDPHPNTSERGHIFGSKAEFNDFRQINVQYTDADFFGGTLNLNAYWADQAMRYPPENGSDRQDPDIPPNGPDGLIWDQSEINSDKVGFRPSWVRGQLFGVDGLELRAGVDWVRDKADQRLALTNRLWVPPMTYESVAPYAQLSWDVGPLTFSGGIRHEDGELSVDDYTTTWFRNRVFVEGGTLSYTETLYNLGAIWRITDQWSVFAAYGEGFGLPNVGIPLRNINYPGQSVNGIIDLQPIVVDNREVGVNWRGDATSFSASYYDSQADFGTSLAIDPATNDFVLNRAPTRIKGFEFSGDWNINEDWKLSGIYSRIRGKTAFWNADTIGRYPAGGLNKPMGALDVNPDKIALSVRWKFNEDGDVTLGSTTLLSRDLTGSDVREFDGATYSYSEHTTGYTLFDLGMNYRVEKWGRFSLGVENLANKQYILTWSQVPGFRNYWAGRGRMYSFTYEYTF